MTMHSRYLLTASFFMILVGCDTNPVVVSPESPVVTVMNLERRELTDHEEFNGWMAADKTVEVRARVRGHIKEIHFADGQHVKKGDLLFELDSRPFETEVGKARDSLRVFEALKVAADKEEARLKALLEKGGASLAQVEKAEADAVALGAQISAAQNEIARSELDLEYSRITADIDGRISKAEMSAGNLVNAGGSDPLLTTIVSVEPIRIYFNIDERSLQRYASNLGSAGGRLADVLANLKDRQSSFSFALDGETGFNHEGQLRFGDNRVDPNTGTIQLYGIVPNREGRFVPGSRVRVRLTIGQPYTAILVPDTAILADQDKRYVLIVDNEKKVRRRNVTLGAITDDGMRAILPAESLAEEEDSAQWQVIVDNLQRARINYPAEIEMSGTSGSGQSS